jgi:hypothetical protein
MPHFGGDTTIGSNTDSAHDFGDDVQAATARAAGLAQMRDQQRSKSARRSPGS